jgi:hypothetical protein
MTRTNHTLPTERSNGSEINKRGAPGGRGPGGWWYGSEVNLQLLVAPPLGCYHTHVQGCLMVRSVGDIMHSDPLVSR